MDRRTWVLAAASLAMAPVVVRADASPTTPEDAAVREAFQRYDDGWRKFNASEVVDAFADEFEWINSAGVRIADKARWLAS
jgi:hypothetical protein